MGLRLLLSQQIADLQSGSGSTPSSSLSRGGEELIMSKEEKIKGILRKMNNDRTISDIITLSNHIEGELGDKYYIVLEGEVKITISVKRGKKEQSEQKEVGRLQEGGAFGELALLFNQIRNATVRLMKTSSFIVLRKEIFQKYIKYKTPVNAHEILTFYDAHLFTQYSLDLPEKIQILSKTDQSNYISNSLIIKQGQPINSLYFVKKGVVKASRVLRFKQNKLNGQLLMDDDDPTEEDRLNGGSLEISLEIDEIYEGSLLADYELFNGIGCAVSYVAYTPCEVLQIQREDLIVLPSKIMSDILGRIKPYPADYKLRRIYLEGLDWQKFKTTLIKGVCTENLMRKTQASQANLFSRSKLLSIREPSQLKCFDDSILADELESSEDIKDIDSRLLKSFFFEKNNSVKKSQKAASNTTQFNQRSSITPQEGRQQFQRSIQAEGSEFLQIQNQYGGGFVADDTNASSYSRLSQRPQGFLPSVQAHAHRSQQSLKKPLPLMENELLDLMNFLDPTSKKQAAKTPLAAGKSLIIPSRMSQEFQSSNNRGLNQLSMKLAVAVNAKQSSQFNSSRNNERSKSQQNRSSQQNAQTFQQKMNPKKVINQFGFSKLQPRKEQQIEKQSRKLLPKFTPHIQSLATQQDVICGTNKRGKKVILRVPSIELF